MEFERHRERAEELVAAFTASGGDRTAEAFAAFAAEQGFGVRLVHGSGGGGPDRVWVRVLNREGIHGYDVDVATGGAPLVWPMDGAHPEAGVLPSLRVSPPGS